MIEYACISRGRETYMKKERGQGKPRQVLLLLLILVVMTVVEMAACVVMWMYVCLFMISNACRWLCEE